VVDNFATQSQFDLGPTVPETLDVRAASRTLDPVSFFDTRDVQINGGTEPVRAISARIEADFLRTLGVQAALGRMFDAADQKQGRDRIVILSDAFWRRNFGADSEPDRSHHHRQCRSAYRHRRAAAGRELRLLHSGTDRPVRAVSDDAGIHFAHGSFSSVRRVTAIARLRDTATIEQA
jgi:hypothetical protein